MYKFLANQLIIRIYHCVWVRYILPKKLQDRKDWKFFYGMNTRFKSIHMNHQVFLFIYKTFFLGIEETRKHYNGLESLTMLWDYCSKGMCALIELREF